jgi:hypothetical protein
MRRSNPLGACMFRKRTSVVPELTIAWGVPAGTSTNVPAPACTSRSSPTVRDKVPASTRKASSSASCRWLSTPCPGLSTMIARFEGRVRTACEELDVADSVTAPWFDDNDRPAHRTPADTAAEGMNPPPNTFEGSTASFTRRSGTCSLPVRPDGRHDHQPLRGHPAEQEPEEVRRDESTQCRSSTVTTTGPRIRLPRAGPPSRRRAGVVATRRRARRWRCSGRSGRPSPGRADPDRPGRRTAPAARVPPWLGESSSRARTSRVFPPPASPATRTAPGFPSDALVTAARRIVSSRSRPTSGTSPSDLTTTCIMAPATGRAGSVRLRLAQALRDHVAQLLWLSRRHGRSSVRSRE